MAAAAAFLRLILRSRFCLCSFRLTFCLFLLLAIGFSYGLRMLTELIVFPPAQPARGHRCMFSIFIRAVR